MLLHSEQNLIPPILTLIVKYLYIYYILFDYNYLFKMKFGNFIKSQMIPEWSEAYIDYAFLKYLLKPFKKFKKNYLYIFYEDNPNVQICNTTIEYLE